jgi:hypothetical protein
VSGEKTLVLFGVLLESELRICFWPALQILRDFAFQHEHKLGKVEASLVDRWIFGMRHFFADLSSLQQGSQNCSAGANLKTLPAPNRMSAHDLLVALDNALRSLGYELVDFLSESKFQTTKQQQQLNAHQLQIERLRRGPCKLPGPLLVLSLDQARFVFFFQIKKTAFLLPCAGHRQHGCSLLRNAPFAATPGGILGFVAPRSERGAGGSAGLGRLACGAGTFARVSLALRPLGWTKILARPARRSSAGLSRLPG